MTPSEILRKHEDANEMHFHDVDRKFIIEAMEEYAKEKSEKPINLTSSQTEISDENAYTNGYLHGYNAAIAELPKEISDEDIEEYAKKNAFQYYEFITGAKWYREQLKTNN